MNRYKKQILIPVLAGLMLAVFPSRSQQLIPGSRKEWILPDCTRVVVYKAETPGDVNNACYYLPANLRISEKNGKPEFSFMSWDSDDDGHIDGAIMHLLLTWGLTEVQEARTLGLMRQKGDSLLYLAGAPMMSARQGNVAFKIVSDTQTGDVLNQSLRSQGSPPLSPGEKMALSFFFSPENAALMEDALLHTEKLKGIKFQLSFLLNEAFSGQPYLLEGDFQEWINKSGWKK